MRQLLYYVCYAIYQVTPYLWWMETLLKCWKNLKYYVLECPRIFLSPSPLEKLTWFSRNCPILNQRKMFYPIKHQQEKLKAFQWQFMTWFKLEKQNLQKSIQIGLVPFLPFFISVLKVKERLCIYKKRSNYWNLKETGTNYKQRFVCKDNHRQNIK